MTEEFNFKYHNKDLNIAYNDGIQEERERMEKKFDEFIKILKAERDNCYMSSDIGMIFDADKFFKIVDKLFGDKLLEDKNG